MGLLELRHPDLFSRKWRTHESTTRQNYFRHLSIRHQDDAREVDAVNQSVVELPPQKKGPWDFWLYGLYVLKISKI
jgi:hypothetical protein